MNTDARRHSPAAERNCGPILAELQRLLPTRGVMLEIASGTGQHATHFAGALSGWHWHPSDAEAAALPSIDAWCAGLSNVSKAVALDVLAKPWLGAPARVDAIFNANMLHISPWATCAALMHGAARHLAPRGVLLLYGPFILDDEAFEVHAIEHALEQCQAAPRRYLAAGEPHLKPVLGRHTIASL